MIKELKDVFELATGCTAFVNELLEIKNTKNKLQQNDNSGYNSQLASSGKYSKLASSGDYSKLASSGKYSQLASSGDYSKLDSSGYYSQLASSGKYSKLASSGNSSKLDSTGKNAVISAIGINNIVKAKKGSWITLAEYDPNNNYKPVCVKSAQIDGEELKADTYYILLDKKFQECVYIDGIISIVISKHKNVYKVRNLGETQESFIVQDGDVYSHGSTIQEAKDSLIYKISNRDTSKFDNYTFKTELTLKEAIEMYRVITGACESGTRYFVENILTDKKEKYTVQEVITLTQGQYNHEKLVEFFKA